jgi:hypothetical protein
MGRLNPTTCCAPIGQHWAAREEYTTWPHDDYQSDCFFALGAGPFATVGILAALENRQARPPIVKAPMMANAAVNSVAFRASSLRSSVLTRVRTLLQCASSYRPDARRQR